MALLAVPATAIAATSDEPAEPSRATVAPAAIGLDDPAKKEIAMQLVSSAENSSLDWKAQYKYIEDIGDGRGYTAGIIGFCSGTGDMLDLVELYTDRKPGNVLAKYLPALREVDGSDSHDGPRPELHQGLEEGRPGLGVPAGPERRARPGLLQPGGRAGQGRTASASLGQFIYYDAIVMHGDGSDSTSFGSIRKRALRQGQAAGAGRRRDDVPERLPRRPGLGDEAGGGARATPAGSTPPSGSSSRTATSTSTPPLDWKVYGDSFHIG